MKSLKGALTQYNWCAYKKTGGDRETQGEECLVPTETEAGLAQLQTRSTKDLPQHQKPREKQRTDSVSEPLREHDPADTLISNLHPPELGEDAWLLLSFAMAALGCGQVHTTFPASMLPRGNDK